MSILQIGAFLAGTKSRRRRGIARPVEVGNRVLRAYLQNNRKVWAVNPNSDEVEGLRSFPNLSSLPITVHGVGHHTAARHAG